MKFTNRIAWTENYVGENPSRTIDGNLDALGEIVGQTHVHTDHSANEAEIAEAEAEGRAVRDITYWLDTPDAASFKRALDAIQSFRGDVLGDVMDFVFRGRTLIKNWEPVNGRRGVSNWNVVERASETKVPMGRKGRES